jgi:hypothetical protein
MSDAVGFVSLFFLSIPYHLVFASVAKGARSVFRTLSRKVIHSLAVAGLPGSFGPEGIIR